MKQSDENDQKCPENEVRSEETAAEEVLPIFCKKQAIMKAVQENSVVIIHGSDKTTQVPQFFYEGGYTQNNKMIGVTEPHKLASLTMAARVGKEMNLPDIVACQVRYSEVNVNTRIKFMTDDVLLIDIKEDPDLTKYSVIIIDEAQERYFFTDVLVGLLYHIVQRRKEKKDPLKVVIMSATMDFEDFMKNPLLFKDEPPVLIQVPSSQYKVQMQYYSHNPFGHMEEAYREVCKIHSLLPAGAILVFLADEEEVTQFCKRLQFKCDFKDYLNYHAEHLNYGSNKEQQKIDNSNLNPNPDSRNNCRDSEERQMQNDIFYFPPNKKGVDAYPVELFDDVEDIQCQLPDAENSFRNSCNTSECDNCKYTLYPLPLHSHLSLEEQVKVFQRPPPNTRLCVVSTNIAETSIAIPGLKYVIDSGKVKTRVRNASEGISRFRTEWISQVSANKRTSCAGYNEGGHCIRLYTYSLFEHHFENCTRPEIKRLSTDDIILHAKNIGIADVINFPFPSLPNRNILKATEKKLLCLRALEVQKRESPNEISREIVLTPSGRIMIHFPISARYAKILMLSHKLRCVSHISAVVSAMTVHDVLLSTVSSEQYETDVYDNLAKDILWNGIKNIGARSGKSLEFGDAMVLLRAVALFEESKDKVKFCTKIGLSCNAMFEIHRVRQQLHIKMKDICKNISWPLKLTIEPPNEEQIEMFQKILAAGFTDHVARLLPEKMTKLNSELKNAYQCLEIRDPVFIHPNSVLFSKSPSYIIYQEIVRASRYYMKGIVVINPEWLYELAPSMCKYSAPLEEPAPSYDFENDKIICTVNVRYGPWRWELPTVTDKMCESILKSKWFCIFLLEGQVYKFFKNYRNHLLLPSLSMLESCATLIPCTSGLLESLHEEKISSRGSLKQKWEKDPKYLLREYLEWLPLKMHVEVESQWPPVS